MLGWETVIWNLFLIGVAMSALFYAKSILKTKPLSNLSRTEKLLFFLWMLVFLAFFPNIAYLFTDSRHVLDYCGVLDEYRRCWEAPWAVLAYFTYSTIAIPFFVIAIDVTARMCAHSIHYSLRHIVPPVMIFLSALGICIGLFDRLNSWDLLFPLVPLRTAASYLMEPNKLFTLLVFTACLGGIFYFFRFFFSRADVFFPKEES